MNEKISLSGMNAQEINEALNLTPAFRGKQIFKWIAKGAESFDGKIAGHLA